jgi:SOS-response transcriptional repressor LexA
MRYIVPMQRKIERVRLANLELLVGEAGTAKELARRAGANESYLSQIRRQLPTVKGTPRCVGDDLAEKLERGMDKPHGWMDEQHVPLEDFQREPLQVHSQPATGIFPSHPLITWEQAGRWHEIADTLDADDAEASLPCPVKCSRRTFVLRVHGESMEPRFQQGELIFVDPEVAAGHGAFVVVRTSDDGQALLRRLIHEGARSFLEASNPAWPNRIREMGPGETVIGVVVFKGQVLG